MNKTISILGSLIVLILFFAAGCSGNQKDRAEQIKFRQYYIKGEQLYLKFCSNCHQEDGTGLGLLYPPLNISDYMSDMEETICIIRYGKQGEITVNGKSYNMAMPAIPQLTDLEVAEIATYIYNTWDHKKGIIDVKTVSSVMDTCR